MHKKLEHKMGNFGLFLHDNPIKTILILILLLAFPISHVPNVLA